MNWMRCWRRIAHVEGLGPGVGGLLVASSCKGLFPDGEGGACAASGRAVPVTPGRGHEHRAVQVAAEVGCAPVWGLRCFGTDRPREGAGWVTGSLPDNEGAAARGGPGSSRGRRGRLGDPQVRASRFCIAHPEPRVKCSEPRRWLRAVAAGWRARGVSTNLLA